MLSFKRNGSPKSSMGLGNYVHDNGFGPRWYVCPWDKCNSIRMEMKVLGGFQPPDFICHDCGRKSGSPVWVKLNPKTGEPIRDTSARYRDPISNKMMNE